ESRVKNAKRYDPRQQFTRFRFAETEQKFDMEAFQMKRTDESLFKSHHQMLNLKQLKHYTDSNRLQLDSISRQILLETRSYVSYFSSDYQVDTVQQVAVGGVRDFLTDYVPEDQSRNILSNALIQAQQMSSVREMKHIEYRTFPEKHIRYH